MTDLRELIEESRNWTSSQMFNPFSTFNNDITQERRDALTLLNSYCEKRQELKYNEKSDVVQKLSKLDSHVPDANLYAWFRQGGMENIKHQIKKAAEFGAKQEKKSKKAKRKAWVEKTKNQPSLVETTTVSPSYLKRGETYASMVKKQGGKKLGKRKSQRKIKRRKRKTYKCKSRR